VPAFPVPAFAVVGEPCPGHSRARTHTAEDPGPAGAGGANVIFEGTATIDPVGPKADAVPAYIGKYREFIDSFGWTPESFAADYPHVIRVTPTRARVW
jgi:hypothetical protein